MVFGLLGNLMVVTVLNLYQNNRWTPSTIILRSLAVSDILVITIVQPLYVYSLFYTLNTNFVELVKASRWALVVASLLHLLIVSVDRFLAICKPNLYHQKLKHSCGWCVVFLFIVWCFTLAQGTALTLVSRSLTRLIHGLVGILCFLVMITLIFIHIRLFFVASKHRKRIEKELKAVKVLKTQSIKNEDAVSRNSHEKNKTYWKQNVTFFRELKAFKTTSVICGAFLFSWLPLQVMGLIYMTTQNVNEKETLLNIFPYVNTLAFLNSAQNPFIYSVNTRIFRESPRTITGRVRSLLKSICN
ncbi:trace amine-associated receptor 7g-like [Dendronephthya gigantea]|uniref:trace amine-associated receptor 7g-like n=1 Tax=Dendronephthya gigantea TaxID=151771 RepID=UPI00106CD63E|nr:trace amine-associated receptor 7g-like [Dendronephthya gigantea]